MSGERPGGDRKGPSQASEIHKRERSYICLWLLSIQF